MPATPHSFIDYSTLGPLPAPRQQPPRPTSAWLIGLAVAALVTVGGTILGPVALVVVLGLSPLYPLTIVLGVCAGAAVGLTAGIVIGLVTVATVAMVRVSRMEVVGG